jgi:gas vesicle protein
MKMETSNHTGSLIGGLLIGALAGAALGILFAPHKGSKTRSNIIGGAKEAANDLKKKMKDEVKAIRRKAKDLENAVKGKLHHETEATIN